MARYLALACTIALTFAPAASAKQWGQREHVPGVDPFGRVQFQADNSGGNGVIVYGVPNDSALYVRYRPLDGPVSEPQRMGTSTVGSDLAVAGDGRAVLAWVEHPSEGPERLLAAVKDPDGAFGPPQELAASGIAIGGLQVAVGGGDMVVAWREQDPGLGFTSSLKVRVREGGSSAFGPDQELARNTAGYVATALADDGSGLLVWTLDDGLGVARRGADGPFTVQAPLRTGGRTTFAGPALAVSPAGTAVVATSSASPGEPNEFHCVGAAGSAASGFGEPKSLSGPGCRGVHAAIGLDERRVAAWRGGKGRRARIRALVERPGKPFGRGLVQSISPRSARGLALAASRSLVAVAWQRQRGKKRRIEVVTSQGGKPFGGHRLVQRMRSGSRPEAGADKRGGVWIAWGRSDGRTPVLNAAVVHSFRISRVQRVAEGADLRPVLPSPFVSRFGASMLLAYSDVAAEPDELDISTYPN